MAGYSMKRSLDEARLLYVTNHGEWRDWLKKHYKSEKEVWLVVLQEAYRRAAHSLQRRS